MSSSWQPEPEPQNELERLIKLAVDDPSVQGKMFGKHGCSEAQSR